MEQIGVMSEEAWSSLSGMYSSKEEAEFLAQLLSGFSSPSELNCGLSLNRTPSGFWGSDQETSCSMMSLVCSSDFCNSAECLVSQETSTFSPDDGQSVLCLGGGFLLSDDVTESRYDVCPSVGNNNVVVSDSVRGLSDQYAPESKKRSRNVEYVTRRKRHLKSDKYTTSSISDSDISGHVRRGEICTSKIVKKTDEKDFNRHITRGESHARRTSKRSGGKAKESKGSPSNHSQSLYARKRRERINERLRILQSLVPNGTKVDISTMLEEAVLYVKFLQLQIKLLSSDETWMYAPLAYNGMDIGISNIDIDTTSPR